MQNNTVEQIIYTILDPTGNITALVESRVEVSRQPSAAAAIMQRHPEVEQVGFVTFPGLSDSVGFSDDTGLPDDPGLSGAADTACLPALRMAGGEFCGNASMCAAVLYARRREEAASDAASCRADPDGAASDAASPAPAPMTVRLRVSGAAEPVTVRLQKDPADPASRAYTASVDMPPAQGIERHTFTCAGPSGSSLAGELPLVRMQGISHIPIEAASPFFALLSAPEAAQRAVRAWCAELGTDGLGLMFLDGSSADCRLTPLVYIPGSDTLFWENSCASGTSAAGIFLAVSAGQPMDVSFREPGGTLRVMSDPSGSAVLSGTVRLCGSHHTV